MAPTTNPTPAPKPFGRRDHDDADVILQSSDQCSFYVHKVILCVASPFFQAMFSLPQPAAPPPPTSDTLAEPFPIIPVTEDRDTIIYLLRLCYPVAPSKPPSSSRAVAKMLEAAIKYDLEGAIDTLKESLFGFINNEPLRVYAHACRLQLTHEANEAAKRWRRCVKNRALRGNGLCKTNAHLNCSSPCNDRNCMFRSFDETLLGLTWADDMEEIPAGCFYRLVCFIHTGKPTRFCDPPSPPPVASSSPTTDPALPQGVDEAFLNFCPSDIVLRSSDMKLIHTYRNFLAFAGATKLLSQACGDGLPLVDPPVVDIDADEATIVGLLRFCQPFAVDIVTDKLFRPEALIRMWRVAQSYKMMGAMRLIKLSWENQIEDSPLASYLTAKRYGWSGAAEKAARLTLDLPLFDGAGYTPEMELVSAEVLRNLYWFQHEHRKTRAAILERARSGVEDWAGEPAVSSSKATKVPLIAAPVLAAHMSLGSNDWSPEVEGRLVQRSEAILQEIEVATHNLYAESQHDLDW